MTSLPNRIRRNGRSAKGSEAGYLLVGVLLMVVMVTLSLSVAAARMAKSIQHDRDQETIERGKQYVRAIRLYYKKFGKYPASIEELEKSNNIRYLRRRYIDPMTGKDDWKPIHMGEAKLPPLGLFGQPMGMPNGGALSGASADQPQAAGAIVNSQAVPQADVNGSVTNPGESTSIAGGLQSGIGTDGGTGGLVFGQIVGFAVPVNKKSLMNYKKQDNYSKWEFVYFPIMEQGMQGLPGQASATQVTGPDQPGQADPNQPGNIHPAPTSLPSAPPPQ